MVSIGGQNVRVSGPLAEWEASAGNFIIWYEIIKLIYNRMLIKYPKDDDKIKIKLKDNKAKKVKFLVSRHRTGSLPLSRQAPGAGNRPQILLTRLQFSYLAPQY